MPAIDIMQYQSGLNEGQITPTWEAWKIAKKFKRQFDINIKFTEQKGRGSIPSRRNHMNKSRGIIWGKG